jgi:hypothetical protein
MIPNSQNTFFRTACKIIFGDMRVKNAADSEGITSLQNFVVPEGAAEFCSGDAVKGEGFPLHKRQRY